jgi:hypothetical protein
LAISEEYIEAPADAKNVGGPGAVLHAAPALVLDEARVAASVLAFGAQGCPKPMGLAHRDFIDRFIHSFCNFRETIAR